MRLGHIACCFRFEKYRSYYLSLVRSGRTFEASKLKQKMIHRACTSANSPEPRDYVLAMIQAWK
jgi:hypothetical protein